jgi:UDP-glucose 4-epimerase
VNAFDSNSHRQAGGLDDGGSAGAMRSVLVTGGAGFIGSHIVDRLLDLGWEVSVFDNLTTGDAANLAPAAKLFEGDLRSDADLAAVFRRRYDAVVHCAAQGNVALSVEDPDQDQAINVEGTRRLLGFAQAKDVGRFVFMSSGGAVYGDTTAPATEATQPAPLSHYGRHKHEAEGLVRDSGLSWAVLRPANVYGPRQRSDAEGGVVAIFVRRLLEGEPIEVQGDGRQTRDLVYASDLVGAVLLALDWPENVTWNVATGKMTSIIALARLATRIAGSPAHILAGPSRPADVRHSLLSNAALSATGRWGPPVSLARGLDLTVAAARDALCRGTLDAPTVRSPETA